MPLAIRREEAEGTGRWGNTRTVWAPIIKWGHQPEGIKSRVIEKTRKMTNTSGTERVEVRQAGAGASFAPSCDPASIIPLSPLSWPRLSQCGVCVATDLHHCLCVTCQWHLRVPDLWSKGHRNWNCPQVQLLHITDNKTLNQALGKGAESASISKGFLHRPGEGGQV